MTEHAAQKEPPCEPLLHEERCGSISSMPPLGESPSSMRELQKFAPAVRSHRNVPRVMSLGVCCMASKATSKPMQEILKRLDRCGNFNIMVFPEETILEKPVSEWPVVQCLIAFASAGFPLHKCVKYCQLVQPLCINDIQAEAIFRNRVSVLNKLQEWCIPCPDHIIIDHTSADVAALVEREDFIEFKGKRLFKPFVEKPADGDRHDIWIYYPQSVGGGAKKLFRKVKDQSSSFDPEQNTIRRDGLYVYEPFLPTQGVDIKVYTVGASYVHAEARKAPTVDGKVNRASDGKEVRYPVVLTQGEKAIAAFIVEAFSQHVCGFDILRTDGGSLVCDVNGWSFVKGNSKYYNDCSALIREKFLETLEDSLGPPMPLVLRDEGDETFNMNLLQDADFSQEHDDASSGVEHLRSVIVVMRHGDRRPKEKMKFKTKFPQILAYFDGADEAELRLTTPQDMEKLTETMLAACKDLREQIKARKEKDAGSESSPKTSQQDDRLKSLRDELMNTELLIPVLTMKDRFSGFERKVQLKAVKWNPQKDDQPRRVAQVLVVAKWGGELTVRGVAQAKELGHRLRVFLYPNDPTGLLRLHSSFRHDFKIYSSQEGRCQITAAAFTKGFLDLEGDIIPILVSLVTRDGFATGLLDEPIPKKQRDAVKQRIEQLLLSPTLLQGEADTPHLGLKEAEKRIGSPFKLLHDIRALASDYIASIAAAKEQTRREIEVHSADEDFSTLDIDEALHEDAVPLGKNSKLGPGPSIPPDLKESRARKFLHLMRKEHRWRKVFHCFVRLKDEDRGYDDDNITFDTSQIPHIWDNLYYDMVTHRAYLGEQSCQLAEKLVSLVNPLNDWVCHSEYGISQQEKLMIGVEVTWRLLGKILGDLEYMIEEKAGIHDEAGRRRSASLNRSTTLSLLEAPQTPMEQPAVISQGIKSGVTKGSILQLRSASPAKKPPAAEAMADAKQKHRPESPRGTLRRETSSGGDSNDNSRVRSKLAKLTDGVRQELKNAMRDSSDWHPRLNTHVAENTPLKNTRMVRSRVYVTSASTMHSLINVLRQFEKSEMASCGSHSKSPLDLVTDLSYLSHLVFRCYEREDVSEEQHDENDPGSSDKKRYRVEIAMSPGVGVSKDGQQVLWPEGADFNQDTATVAPLQTIAHSGELSRFENFITASIKDLGSNQLGDDEDGDQPSDRN